MTDYIPEIIFTALIADRTWAQAHRAEVVAFLGALMDATQWLYDPTDEAALVSLTSEITQAEGHYGKQALAYMREKNVFPRDLTISPAAFGKSIELMQKAGLADAALVAAAPAVLDDSYRAAARAN